MSKKTWIAALIAATLPALAAAAPVPAAPDTPAAAMHMGHGAPAARSAAGGHAGGHSMSGMAAAAPADVASPDALLAAFYDAISGPAGKARDRERFLSLFFPGARLLPAEGKGHSGTMPMEFSAATFLFDTQSNMLADGFVEKEVARKGTGFGKIFQVLSTYEARHGAADARPFVRGVNSFQLFFDGKRWWIFSLAWQPETARLTLPAELLR
jgi:hypothetical protein